MKYLIWVYSSVDEKKQEVVGYEINNEGKVVVKSKTNR